MASIKRIAGKGGTSFKIVVSMGRDAQGRQIRHYLTWKPDRPMTPRQMEKEVQRVAYEFEQQITSGFIADDRQTFAEYAKYHQEIRKQRGDRPGTIETAQRAINRALPYIGNMKMRDIRPQHLNAFYMALAKPGANRWQPRVFLRVPFDSLDISVAELARRSGLSKATITELKKGRSISISSADKISAVLKRKNIFDVQGGDQPLAPRTIEGYHSVISAIFSHAAREMILQYNPAERTTRPGRRKKMEPTYLQPDQLQMLIDALADESIKFRVMMYLFIVTGCRRGEIMALKWGKVDFENNQILIDASLSYLPGRGVYEGPTKTGNSRYITIPGEVTQLLRKYRAWQTEQRLMMGDQWRETGYLFTGRTGEPQNPTNVNKLMKEFANRHGLPYIHPHTFRHTAASIMISRGVDILTVSKMLGHRNTSMTLDVYSHEVAEAKRRAADCIADVILRKENA